MTSSHHPQQQASQGSEGMLPETLTDALIECVKAAGGSKVVGSRLWPEKQVDAAQRHLLNCLQEGRAEHLKPEQVLFILRLARNAGAHVGMHYLAHSLGYSQPRPITVLDEMGDLQRKFLGATKELRGMVNRFEQLEALAAEEPRTTLRGVA